MNKAVLVFDMPRSCIECPCLDENLVSRTCGAMEEYAKLDKFEVFSKKPDWCPLIDMPEKYVLSDDDDDFDDGWSRGFNYCINRILDAF